MNNRDRSKVENSIRQIVFDDIRRLGIEAVKVMAQDLRRSGYLEKASLIDLLIAEYGSQASDAKPPG